MRRPLWFRRRGLHWTPCAWPGWLIIGVYVLLVLAAALRWSGSSTAVFVALTLVLAVMLITIAVLTDDTHPPAP